LNRKRLEALHANLNSQFHFEHSSRSLSQVAFKSGNSPVIATKVMMQAQTAPIKAQGFEPCCTGPENSNRPALTLDELWTNSIARHRSVDCNVCEENNDERFTLDGETQA
jgi:hypothetical protein